MENTLHSFMISLVQRGAWACIKGNHQSFNPNDNIFLGTDICTLFVGRPAMDPGNEEGVTWLKSSCHVVSSKHIAITRNVVSSKVEIHDICGKHDIGMKVYVRGDTSNCILNTIANKMFDVEPKLSAELKPGEIYAVEVGGEMGQQSGGVMFSIAIAPVDIHNM